MAIRNGLGKLLSALLILAVVALLVGQVLGQPILLGYVETDSMEPELSPGDGYVAVPAALAGPVEQGDVVVFRAEQLHGGGLTTHRVVGRTDRGYLTRGDANAFTDQDAGEPPVREEQIVAKAVQVNGHVIAVPGLGTVVTTVRTVVSRVQRTVAATTGIGSLVGPRGFGYLFFAASLVVYAVGALRERTRRERRRSRSRVAGIDARLVVGAMAALLVVAATASMAIPSGPTEFGIYSTGSGLDESSPPSHVPAGGDRANEIRVSNGGFLPVVTFLEPGSRWTEVQPREIYLDGRSETTVTATFAVPEETGPYRRYVVEHRYLAVLPVPAIRWLYGVHPWAPIAVIDALLAGGFYLGGLAVVGSGRLPERTRDRGISVWTRLRRAVKRRY